MNDTRVLICFLNLIAMFFKTEIFSWDLKQCKAGEDLKGSGNSFLYLILNYNQSRNFVTGKVFVRISTACTVHHIMQQLHSFYLVTHVHIGLLMKPHSHIWWMQSQWWSWLLGDYSRKIDGENVIPKPRKISH